MNTVENKVPDMPASAPASRWIRTPAHFVQFYEKDEFLQRTLGEFVVDGWQAGSAAVVIATLPHLRALEAILSAKGFDVASVTSMGLYYPLVAADTLAHITVQDHPDPHRFNEVVGSVVARASRQNVPVRAFGEMVALLWDQGRIAAALELEELWNDLAKRYRFTLCCAYQMRGFERENHSKPFAEICGSHSHVLPSESYSTSESNPDERLRTIALLQQKAASLEAEIARRKIAERILDREKQELSDFLENACEAIHKVGADGRIIWANRAELDLLGYAEGEYVGRHIAEFHQDPEVIADILARLARGEKLRDYEARLKHRDGSLRYVSINSSVYRRDEQFAYTKCFSRDITERKIAAELLEKKVAERTEELKEALGDLEAFSYSVSHDLRAPLRAMQGYARSLIQDYGAIFPEEAFGRLRRIDTAATRLDLLVQDILAYSRVSMGEMHLARLSLEALVKEAIEQHPVIESRRDRISVGVLHPVMGHAAYVSQCLTNLIENALKFVPPERSPKIHVGSEKIDGRVRVYVRDNGIGIDPAHRARIFGMFSRIHPDSQYEGTGIGLAMVKKAVSRMNGAVGFDSQPGCGSTFWFTLPGG